MTLQQVIQEFKHKTGLRDAHIAQRLNISRSTVTRWSKGEVKRLSPEILEKLSELVGYDLEPILKGYDMEFSLPILGYVKAGYDLFAEENYIGEETATYDEVKKNDFYLQVTGNSMMNVGIMDGSYVLVKRTDVIDNGEVGVVLIGDEVTVKKVIKKDQTLILEAANPEVENRYFTAEEVRSLPVQIIGKVVSCKTYF